MRVALLAPLPPEQTGIADYAALLRAALEVSGVEVVTPLAGCGNDPERAVGRVQAFDWSTVDLVHAELGGGRLAEFHALRELRTRFPQLPLTATVHDPERLVWRRASLPWPLSLASSLPSPWPQAATVLADPLCLHEERRLAGSLSGLITLTATGRACLIKRMRLDADKVHVIHHGNQELAPAPLPPLAPIRLLYFGFIYRGKGIEDLLDALALVIERQPHAAERLKLTLAGGSAPETAFEPGESYLDQLRRRIVEKGLASLIEWRLDIPATEIAEQIQAHHVMVLPYRESKKLSLLGAQRGTSGALSWAAACGRGAITSDARAFAEEVSTGNGTTFPQGDVQALAARLQDLLEQPQLCQQWAGRAAEIGRERLWSVTAKRFKALFADLCGG
ncbi:glycosyltransferase [Pseudomonas sp. PDM16]|uniref:glycosyltransferase n=1 Tax=Pseudomonas sp. PDM16 TaxID=2769292 RepID=UPI00177E6297|nr:glycosyltransferase [Pseudomonas sp. PDM16]MBD9414955.1 glycosyltransferase [Pseudomonas sp. PDM16]